MAMFENKEYQTNLRAEPIHGSRLIASWRNKGGKYYDEWFIRWLMSIGLSADDSSEVRALAIIGAYESDIAAKDFIGKIPENRSR